MSYLLSLNALKGVGVPSTQMMPITSPQAIILARHGFSFTNAEACDALADWLAAVANKDLYVIPNIRGDENQKVADGKHETDFGDKIHLWDGKPGKTLKCTFSKDQHEIIESYSDKKWDMFILDRNNNIHAILNDDDTITGIELDYFHVDTLDDPDSGNPAFTTIGYQFDDPKEFSLKGCIFSPTWRVKNIVPVTYVTITCGTVATNAFTMSAAYVPTKIFDTDGSALSIPLTGLVLADVKVIDQTGAENSLVSVTEDTETEGDYVVTGDTLTSGTCELVPSATSMYESNVATLSEA